MTRIKYIFKISSFKIEGKNLSRIIQVLYWDTKIKIQSTTAVINFNNEESK